jgi:hypothetical protein
VDAVYEYECDYLMFVDADTRPPPNAAVKLMTTMRETNAQIVSGHYYQRGYPYACIWAMTDGKTSWHVDAASGVHVIHGCGMGCVVIDAKWCREHVTRPWFKLDGKLWEDFYFCKKVQEAGGAVVGNADVRAVHVNGAYEINDITADLAREGWVRQEHAGGKRAAGDWS